MSEGPVYRERMTELMWGPDDDAHAAVAGYGPNEPFLSATTFLAGVSDDATTPEELRVIVTPESFAAWGDLSAIRDYLADLGDWGVGSYPNPAPGAPDVAYVKILRDVAQTYQVESDGLVPVAALLTLIWRPEFGLWLVHSIGGVADVSTLPRTSPGVAPAYTHAQ